MVTYGIMQGRLTPEKGRGIQFFPFDNWENEFYEAGQAGLDEIEWIFDYDRFEENPMWTRKGRKRIIELIRETNVIVKSVCFDYFMRRPFYKYDTMAKGQVYKENMEFVTRVLQGMKEIGASILEIPVVDNSSVKGIAEQAELTEFIHRVCGLAEQSGIRIGLETDFRPGIFRDYLDTFDGKVYANYDSGNSSGLGYDPGEEIMSLGAYILNVHIKDRQFQGATKRLGTGSADFDRVFQSLKKINYKNSFILQAARGKEGSEIQTIKSQLEFVKGYIEKYSIAAD